MKRSAFTNALFCLLLTLAAALFALSAGLWYSVYKTGQSLDDMVTTIAMPDMFAVRRQTRNIVESGDYSTLKYVDTSNDNQIIFDLAEGHQVILEDGIRIITIYSDDNQHSYEGDIGWIRHYLQQLVQDAIIREINEDVFDSGLIETDDRRVYGAYVEGLKSVPSRHSEDGDYDRFVESLPQSTAAFVVRCTEVIESFRLLGLGTDGIDRTYIGRFEVEQEIYLHEGRRTTRTVTGYFPFSNPDRSAPIEEGKRYIISGHSYAQGDRGPSWYDSSGWMIFPSNIIMPGAMIVDIIGGNADLKTIGYFDSLGELPSGADIEIVRFMQYSGYEVTDYFPMDIREWIPEMSDTLGHEGLMWFEIEGSLEEALASERGKQIEDALSVAKISVNSLQVLTTNDVNSLFRFNQRVNKITGGRTLSDRDYETGAFVCLISEQLAEVNGLSIGDKLPMQLYNTTLGQLQMTGLESAWIPSIYHPGLGLTEPIEYEIVGIYSGLTQEMRDHTISASTVIIPASSFEGVGLDAEEVPYSRLGSSYSPPLLRTIIIPNGKVDEAKAEIDEIAEGFSLFFRFYDQGFARLVPIIENLHFGMSWILALSIVGWAVSVVMFSLFYVGRRVNDMSLLYGIGVSKAKCFIWVFVQCLILVLLSHGIVIAAMLPVYESILESALAVSGEFTEVYRNFILSDMNVAGGIRFTLPLDRTVMGLVYAAVGSVGVFLSHHQ